MYKKHTNEDFKKYFGIPLDYKVDGVLSYGSWRKTEHKDIVRKIIKELGLKVEYENIGGSIVREIMVFKINGKRFWFETGYGGAYISEIFHFGSMFGSKKNIILGTCGGLNKSAETGEIIIPTYSFGNESTTRMYDLILNENKHFSNEKLNNNLFKRSEGITKIYRGPVMTCQAMLAERWQDVSEWSSQGYLGVEMETSTVFAVSKHFNVPASAILVVADNLIKKETVLHGNYKDVKENRDRMRDLTYKIELEELI